MRTRTRWRWARDSWLGTVLYQGTIFEMRDKLAHGLAVLTLLALYVRLGMGLLGWPLWPGLVALEVAMWGWELLEGWRFYHHWMPRLRALIPPTATVPGGLLNSPGYLIGTLVGHGVTVPAWPAACDEPSWRDVVAGHAGLGLGLALLVLGVNT